MIAETDGMRGLYIDGEACSGHAFFKRKERRTETKGGDVVDKRL